MEMVEAKEEWKAFHNKKLQNTYVEIAFYWENSKKRMKNCFYRRNEGITWQLHL